MHLLLITTLEAVTVRKSPKGFSTHLVPKATTTASFMSEEARDIAIKRLDEYNFKRKAEDMAPIIGHISYMYVKL